jgi:hypothetical protein
MPQITITEQQLQPFMFLADFLDNRILKKQCLKVTNNNPQIFKLSTKIFICYPKSWVNKLVDFELNINNCLMSINFSLFSCLCDKFDQSIYHQKIPPISIPKEHLNCFLSFFDVMKGYPFHFSNFTFSNLKYLIDCFGISSLVQILLSKVPVPENIEKSLEFITQHCCEILEEHFNRSLSLIIQNFSSIPVETLNKISNSCLIRIISSDLLQIKSENYLFKIIMKMIEEDQN